MKEMNKKGVGFGDMLPLVLTFIIAGLGIIIGAYLVSEIKTTLSTSASATEINETLASVENVTGEYVSKYTIDGFGMNTSPACINASDGDVIPSSNLSANTAGLIKSVSSNCTGDPHGFCNFDWNCTYIYDYTTLDAAYNASGKVEKGITTFGNMMPIIAIALVFAIIISIIIGFLVIKGRR